MEEITQRRPHVQFPEILPARRDGGWAGSSVLYLLTCYDVWSATPPRGCEPVAAEPAEEAQPTL